MLDNVFFFLVNIQNKLIRFSEIEDQDLSLALNNITEATLNLDFGGYRLLELY